MIKDDILSKIGQKIKLRRKNRGMNLEELATASGVSTGLITKIEKL